ncbi:MAG: MopE-related protein, partial [Bradymonadia bacterium]
DDMAEPESCNGRDDDCDGLIDEETSELNACGGCGPVPVENCDGIDNDCDGVIDQISLDALVLVLAAERIAENAYTVLQSITSGFEPRSMAMSSTQLFWANQDQISPQIVGLPDALRNPPAGYIATPMALYREGAVDNDTIYGLVVNYDPDNNGDGIAEASRASSAKIYRYRVNENANNAQQRLQALDSIELYHHVFAAVDDGNNLNLIINGGPSPDRLFMLRLSKDVLTNDVAGRAINIFDAMTCIDNNLVRALGGDDCEAACPVASTSGEGDVLNVLDSALIELVDAPNANTTGVSVDMSEAFTLNHAENPRHLIAIGGGEQLPGLEEMGQAAEKTGQLFMYGLHGGVHCAIRPVEDEGRPIFDMVEDQAGRNFNDGVTPLQNVQVEFMTFHGRPAAAISVSGGSQNSGWDHILWHREIWPYEDDNTLNPLNARKDQSIAVGQREDEEGNDWRDGFGFVQLFRAPGGQTMMAWNESLSDPAGAPLRVHKLAHFSTRELTNLDRIAELERENAGLERISYRNFERAIYQTDARGQGVWFQKYIGCP